MHPLAFFQQYDPQAFLRWTRGNGSSSGQTYAPTFDHTYFNNEGHYLYISTDLVAEEQRKTTIMTPYFVPSTEADGCELRFYVRLHGKGKGNLTVYTE